MTIWKSLLLAGTMLATCSSAWAGQAPGALSAPDVSISHHDRVYAAEQFSNTLSVTDPVDIAARLDRHVVHHLGHRSVVLFQERSLVEHSRRSRLRGRVGFVREDV